MQTLCCENEFYLYENKNNLHVNGFTLSLALKQRLGATRKWPTVHVTATGGNQAGVNLVLMQHFLLYNINHVVLTLTSIFSIIFMRKVKRFLSKQGQHQPHVH